MKAKEVHENFQKTLGDSSPSYSTLSKWIDQIIKFGLKSLKDDSYSGCQEVPTIPDTIAEVCDLGGLPTKNSEKFLKL